MSGFPLSKKKKVLIILAAVLLVVMVTLPFLLNNDRVRTSLTLVSRGDVLQTAKAEGVFSQNGGSQTLSTPNKTCRAPEFLLGKPVKKGDVLLLSDDGFALKAPFDGFVTALKEGENASVTVTAPVTDTLVVYVDREAAAALKKGQALISADGKKKFGQVADFGSSFVENGALSGIPVSVSLKEGEEKLSEHLLPGEPFLLHIELQRAEKVLYVPTKAICYDATGNPFVYVVNDSHRAEIVFPKFGIIGDDRAEILGGLTMDERIVLDVPEGLHEGTKVLPEYVES